MGKSTLIIRFIVCMCYVSMVTAYSSTGEGAIRNSVLSSISYDRMARPNGTTTAYVGFSLLTINDVDIALQEFICTGWFTVLWYDDRLTWKPFIYDDTQHIHALEAEIWKPEVLIYNAKENVGLISDDHLIFRIKYTGDVHWEPLMSLTVHCSIDVTYFPYDTQTCSLEFSSWGLPDDEMLLKMLWDDIKFDEFEQNGSWEITSTHVEESTVIENNNGTVEHFSKIEFTFNLKRKPGNYVFTTIVPLVLTSFLMPLTSLIPIASGERLTSSFLVSVVNVLLMTAFLIQIPDIATSTSILAIYLSVDICIDTFLILSSVILSRVYYQPNNKPVGRLQRVIIITLKVITCYCEYPLPDEPAVDVPIMSLPTDDLKKVERSIKIKRNAINPEEGFTEHENVKLPLPAIHPRPETSTEYLKHFQSTKSGDYSTDSIKREAIKPKYPELSWTVVAEVWDRVLLLVAISLKIAYNMILIGQMWRGPQP